MNSISIKLLYILVYELITGFNNVRCLVTLTRTVLGFWGQIWGQKNRELIVGENRIKRRFYGGRNSTFVAGGNYLGEYSTNFNEVGKRRGLLE